MWKHNRDKDESKEEEDEDREEEDGDGEQPFDLVFFDAIFLSATKVQTTIADDAADNLRAAQKNKTKTSLWS